MKKCCCLLLAVLLASILSVAAADATLTPVIFCLDWTPNTNHTGVYAAQALGYYEEVGLDVQIVQPPENGAVLMCAAGQAQFAVDAQDTMAASLDLDHPLGVTAVAAVAAGGKLSMFFSCVFDALATTMATYAGQNMGAREVDRIQKGVLSASIIGGIYSLLAFLVILLFGPLLLGLFVDGASDPLVMQMAIRYIRFNGAFYIPLMFVNVLRLSIQGMGYTKVAMLAGVFEMVARTLVALLLVPVLGFTGASLANPAAWLMADLFLFPCYVRVIRSVRERLHVPVAGPALPLFHKEEGYADSLSRRSSRQHGRNARHGKRPARHLA